MGERLVHLYNDGKARWAIYPDFRGGLVAIKFETAEAASGAEIAVASFDGGTVEAANPQVRSPGSVRIPPAHFRAGMRRSPRRDPIRAASSLVRGPEGHTGQVPTLFYARPVRLPTPKCVHPVQYASRQHIFAQA